MDFLSVYYVPFYLILPLYTHVHSFRVISVRYPFGRREQKSKYACAEELLCMSELKGGVTITNIHNSIALAGLHCLQ